MFVQRLTSQAVQLRRALVDCSERLLALAGLLDETWLDAALGIAPLVRNTRKRALSHKFERDYFRSSLFQGRCFVCSCSA